MSKNNNITKDLFDLYSSARKASAKDHSAISARLAEMRDEIMQSFDSFEYESYPLFAQLIALYVPLDPGVLSLGAMAAQPNGFADMGPTLGGIASQNPPGVSLVTCSKNRTENLIKALPSWLRHSKISEVMIVDWGSDTPIAGSLREAGFDDARIRIVRVENEPRWILSYAFNVGFRAASFDTILKADADIVLSEDFFAHNRLDPGSFIAGNWRNAADNQAYVNGFFMLPVRALHDTNGFNEFITTYGWDDDDIYDRLTLEGYRRQDVVPDTVFHLPHSDDERLGTTETFRDSRPSMLEKLSDGTQLLIHTNRVLTGVMPRWGTNQQLLPFVNEAVNGHVLTLRRQGWVPSVVPAHTLAMARDQALTDLLSWSLGARVRNLVPKVLHRILSRPADEISRIDVEVGLAAPDKLLRGPGRYLVANVKNPGILTGEKGAALADVIQSLASRWAMRPVLRAALTALPASADNALRTLPLIPAWENIGTVPTVTQSALRDGKGLPDGNVLLEVDDQILSAPAIAPNRKRLFIDAQHGLGNRMRAIGSAAAIAKATDRELVIVWEPDHHCDGKFSDLFDYDQAVIGRCFTEDARDQGLQVYNYMPMEPGSEKSVLIDTEQNKDIYARAAFVLESPHSTWGTENRFIQQLTPIEAVRDLVNSVRHPNDMTAHVRMEAGAGLDNNTYDRPENWGEEDHKLIHEWRAKSHFSHFMVRIDALLATAGVNTLFLAADLPGTYDEFQDRYGERLAWLPRTLYDRSAEQLHYALADAILLSRAPLMLGSTWSSFSELAMRLAPGGIKVEMSGKDF